jgi:4-amino-4-deoxy-L-arabinose transferase-like glycosyltransferase
VLASAGILLAVHFLASIGLSRWHHPDFSFAFEAGSIAKSLATSGNYSSPLGRETGPTAWLSPLYPFLLSLVFRLFGVYTTASALVALALNSAISSATCLAVAAIVWRISHDKLAVPVSALLITLSPCTAFMSFQIWDTALTGFLLSLFLWLALLLTSQPSLKLAIFVGVAGGLLFLANAGAGSIFIPVSLLVISLRIPLKRTLISSGVFLVLGSPWVARNYIVFGKIEPRCCAGFELKMGNNEAIWQTGSTAFLPSQHPSVNPRELDNYASQGEVAYDRNCMREALEFIHADYWRFAFMTARRIRDFWFGSFNWTNGLGSGRGLFPFLMDLLYFSALCSVPLFSLLGAFGLIHAVANGHTVGLLAGFLLVYPPLLYVNSVNLRLQYPAQLVLIVFGGIALSGAMELPFRALVGRVRFTPPSAKRQSAERGSSGYPD